MAAVRECKEEAGIDIELKGVLRVEHSVGYDDARMRVIFYAEPKNCWQVPKQIPDSESLCARWVTLEEFKGLDKIRGWELLEWGTYLQNGGQIYPPEVLGKESDMVKARGEAFTIPNKGNEEIK